jgi:hypothetical protein
MFANAVLNLCHLLALRYLDSLGGKRLVDTSEALGGQGEPKSTAGTDRKSFACYNSLAYS